MFFCAGHLFLFVSRLKHSEKVGILVSMVLVLTLLLCSSFSRFTVKNSEQGAQRRGRVSVSWNALTAVQMPETGCTAHRGCNMFFCASHLFHFVSRLNILRR